MSEQTGAECQGGPLDGKIVWLDRGSRVFHYYVSMATPGVLAIRCEGEDITPPRLLIHRYVLSRTRARSRALYYKYVGT